MKITRILRNIYMNTKRHYRRFMFMLTMLSAATFGTAQTSFVPGDGCLNVIDVHSVPPYVHLSDAAWRLSVGGRHILGASILSEFY